MIHAGKKKHIWEHVQSINCTVGALAKQECKWTAKGAPANKQSHTEKKKKYASEILKIFIKFTDQ